MFEILGLWLVAFIFFTYTTKPINPLTNKVRRIYGSLFSRKFRYYYNDTKYNSYYIDSKRHRTYVRQNILGIWREVD